MRIWGFVWRMLIGVMLLTGAVNAYNMGSIILLIIYGAVGCFAIYRACYVLIKGSQKVSGTSNKEPSPQDTSETSFRHLAKNTAKWQHAVVILLVVAVITYVVNTAKKQVLPEPNSTAQHQQSLSVPEKDNALQQYSAALEGQLSQAFDAVSVTCETDKQGYSLITAQVAKQGISSSTNNLKNSGDTENEAYLEFLNKLVSFTERILNDADSAGIEDVHIELIVLDDIELSNNALTGDDYVTSIVEIYDTDIRYDIMQDKSPESFIPKDEITIGKQNALRAACSYIENMPFSYEGLVKQLEFEKYTHEEAVYGADNCGADWYEQAALKAASYLDLTSFSREGLIEQLEFEGFARDQAVYGAKMNGY